MSCEWIEEVSALIDDELPPDRARVLERHVALCEDCQKIRAEFLQLRSQVATFSPALDRADSRHRLAQILGTGYKPQLSPSQPRAVGFFGWLRPSSAFAAIAFLLILGFLGLLVYRSSHRPANPVAPGTYQANQRNGSSANSGAGVTGSIPRTPFTNNKGAAKPGGKVPKKTRPRVETPKPVFNPPELTSPYGSQVIALNNAAGTDAANIQPVDAENLTARHFEQTELLLRSFRNLRGARVGLGAAVAYERRRAQKLVYQNIMLRREADASGDVQVSTLLDSLEPILLDIANLPDQPHDKDVSDIKERVQRKNLVALLQVNSAGLARANE